MTGGQEYHAWPVLVSWAARNRLAAVAAALGQERGIVASLGEAVEHLLDEHPGRVSCGEAHAGMDIYCLPDGTHPRKCCGTA